MGNTQQQEGQSQRKLASHRFCLQIRDREIVLDYRNKMKLTIGDVISFPAGGFEGLHLWDSNIILARYVLVNTDMFASRTVIQLLSGTGIASITARKYTKASMVTATDNSPQVVQNLQKNVQKNNLTQGISLSLIDLASPKDYKTKYNIVMGADLLFKGCPVELLLHSFDKLLQVGGKVIIIVPDKKGNDSTSEFVSKIDGTVWMWRKERLIEEVYLDSPLLNQVQGLQEFPDIADGIFYLYMLEKIKQKRDNKQFQIPKNITMSRKTSHKSEEDKERIEPKVQIKQQVLDKEKQVKKQLEVVIINKNDHIPEYQRNKRKTITEIIAESEQQKGVIKQPSVKSNQKQFQDDIEMVDKEHELHDQPAKKSESDKNESKSNREKMDEIVVNEEENIRMRKKSNPLN